MASITQVMEVHGNQCFYCGHKLCTHYQYKIGGDARIATVEHLIPKSIVRCHDIRNLRPACTDCNSKRNNGFYPLEAQHMLVCPLIRLAAAHNLCWVPSKNRTRSIIGENKPSGLKGRQVTLWYKRMVKRLKECPV